MSGMTDKYPLSFGAGEAAIRQAPDSACPLLSAAKQWRASPKGEVLKSSVSKKMPGGRCSRWKTS